MVLCVLGIDANRDGLIYNILHDTRANHDACATRGRPTSARCFVPWPGRALHYDVARHFQVPRQMFGRDLGHHLAAGLELPATIEGQGECEGTAEVVGVRSTEGRIVWHGGSLADSGERSKNFGVTIMHRRRAVTADKYSH